jgi:hypothetical protein
MCCLWFGGVGRSEKKASKERWLEGKRAGVEKSRADKREIHGGLRL